MRARGPARLAWSLWGFAIALNATFAGLVIVSWGAPGPTEFDELPLVTVLFIMLVLSFASVGAVIASRQPRNSIGWLFCASGVSFSAGICSLAYADYALYASGGALPGGTLAAWSASWLTIPGLTVIPVFLLLLFPTGRPASAAWRWVVRAGVAMVCLGFIGTWFKPGPLQPFTSVSNPIGLHGSPGSAVNWLNSAFTLSAVPFLGLAVLAIVSRFRHSEGDERQQLKWFAYVATLMGTSFALSFVPRPESFGVARDVLFIAGAIALVGLPVATGTAILKYRLYDIDVIINRTLVYGALSLLLALTYVAGVVGLGGALRAITDQQDNGLAVAASTLVVAGLFRPARARIQSFIDRRFYRSRYDAAQTLEAFGGRLRDEVDLEALTTDLLGVVRTTMNPEHLSLWLRGPAR